MPTINKLPIGGVSGIDGNATLNLYTQMSEPTKKDGIWVQTNHQYQKAIIDNSHIDNTGTWTNTKNSGLQDRWYHIRGVYNGELYRMQFQYSGSIPLYKTNNVLQCIDNNTTVTWTQVGAFSYNADSSTFDGTSLYRAIVCNGKLYIAVGYTNSYPDVRHIIFEYDASTNSCNTAYIGFPAGDNYDFFTYNNDLYEITTEDAGYVAINKINTVSGSKTLIRNIDYSDNRFYGSPSAICSNGYIFVSYYERPSTEFDYSYNSGVYKFNNNNELEHIGSISPAIRSQSSCLFFLYNNIPCMVYSDTDNGYDKYIYGIIKQNDGSSYYNAKLTKLISAPPDGNKISVIGKYLISNEGYVYTASANTYDPQTLIIQRNTSNNGTYKTGIYDLKSAIPKDLQPLIEGDANRCLYAFDDCYYFADTGFDWTAPMYYGDGTKWIKFKN